jgi:hypothetical protein
VCFSGQDPGCCGKHTPNQAALCAWMMCLAVMFVVGWLAQHCPGQLLQYSSSQRPKVSATALTNSGQWPTQRTELNNKQWEEYISTPQSPQVQHCFPPPASTNPPAPNNSAAAYRCGYYHLPQSSSSLLCSAGELSECCLARLLPMPAEAAAGWALGAGPPTGFTVALQSSQPAHTQSRAQQAAWWLVGSTVAPAVLTNGLLCCRAATSVPHGCCLTAT